MLQESLKNTLRDAYTLAQSYFHEIVTLDHLFHALLSNEEVVKVLKSCDADIETLIQSTESLLENHYPKVTNEQEVVSLEISPSIGFQRVIQRAIYQVQGSGQDNVNGSHVLVSLFAEPDCHGVYFLELQGIERIDIVTLLSHELGEEEAAEDQDGFSGNETEPKALSKYAHSLNEKAMDGLIDTVIGREPELKRCMQILCRRRKNNPILVGDPGVGKTAVAEGLALDIVNGDVPEILLDAEVFALDIGALLAGTKYRGDFEKRLKGVLVDIQKHPNAVLFIDEIHTIIGAGSTGGGSLDASNLIKPLLASGDMKCIGATTYEEFREIFEKDKALSRRFQKIDIEEPSLDETIAILKGLRPVLEAHHSVKYTNQALEKAAHLSYRYINDRKAPDKAIDVLDEAGAKLQLQGEQGKIGIREIEHVVAQISKVPVEQMSAKQVSSLKRLEADLQRVLYGQNEAINTLSRAIKRAKAGLNAPEKPLGSFLFAGPTGVGKTELCKQLSKQLGIEMIRFDMSEYMERHAVSRLIGAPPGYVGFDQGGLLTEAVVRSPHSLILFDEIEKAHPDLFNVLLQVLDYGTLTDNNGRKADFRNTILVMTSNVGAEQAQRSSMGFVEQHHELDIDNALKQTFSPEFRNRLDKMIMFNRLSEQDVLKVVDKSLFELEQRLESQSVKLDVSPQARQWLAKEGYHPQMGARPMARLVQDQLSTPLADELLFGALKKGGVARIDLDDKKKQLALSFVAKKATKSQASKSKV